MVVTLRLLFSGACLSAALLAGAQNTDPGGCKPNIRRQLFHDYIDREQKTALRADGRADALFHASNNEDINYLVSQAMTLGVDALQCRIEQDTAIAHREKVAYLRGLERMMRRFTSYFRSSRFPASNFPSALELYEAAITRDKRGESIERLFERTSYEIGNLSLDSMAFERNPGYRAARNSMVLKYSLLHPERIFYMLKDNVNVPFRDSLIKVAAYKYPNLLYDYAAANNRLGYAIAKIDDPLIRTVSQIARSGGSGQLYFPFLDNILAGNQTLAEIDAVKNDDAKFYKLLVKTRLDYVARQQRKEKVHAMEPLSSMLEKRAREVFVKEINARHEEPDASRFRVLQQFNAQELYYLIVSSDGEIYTSSYTNGVYPLVMQRAGNRGDSLLMSVGFDRFKKFIRMAAGYNTLSHFLSSFPDGEQAKTLMTAFVNGLERSEGLEDGVDVADSYASIAETLKPVADDMLQNIRQNYERNVAANNKRGVVIYDLLQKLFLSADTTQNIDLSKEFGIPPVYSVSHSTLTVDSTQRVVMQVFFYGDEDGRIYFQDYLRNFPSSQWRRVETSQWVEFSSLRGKPVSVYANKPLPEEKNLDAEAQSALSNYLAEKELMPTVIVHRGHSYYAPYTINQIPPSAKIVFLGSCGGYHLIHDVLEHAPDAHIISSKQIGKGNINQPFINMLTGKVRDGENIDWVSFWREFGSRVKVEGFEDYIPPHKNLGAIFIKAYKNAMGEEAVD